MMNFFDVKKIFGGIPWWVIGVAIAAVIAALIVPSNRRRRSPALSDSDYIFRGKEKILSPNEQKWYRLLKETFPESEIFAQVNMSSLIDTGKHQISFNKISQKSIDFIICNKGFSVIAAIEIDDSSHKLEDRIKSDNEKDWALQMAGIKIIRWKSNPMPTKQELVKKFAETVLRKEP